MKPVPNAVSMYSRSSSFSISKTIERYQKRAKDLGFSSKGQENMQVCPPFAFARGDYL